VPNRIGFCTTYRSAVEVPKVTQISISERQRALTVTETGYGVCFRFDLCIPSNSGRSNDVSFLQKFFVRLIVLLLQGFEVIHPFFDDVANVANGKAFVKLVH